jgi:hypothetical protein
MSKEEAEQKTRLSIPLVIGALIVMVILGGSVYYFYRYQSQQDLLLNPNKAAEQDLKDTVSRVRKLMALPKEDPSLATVTDKSQLADQPFFKNAQNGDRVLMYLKEQKAIIYRPSTNQIVDVGPINITSASDSAQQENVAGVATDSAQKKPVTIAIYNGTTVAGLASVTETELKSKIPNAQVIAKQNAALSNYTKNEVIDVKGTNAAYAKEVAAALNGTVVKAPQGETMPQADILIIAGKETAPTAVPTVTSTEGNTPTQ